MIRDPSLPAAERSLAEGASFHERLRGRRQHLAALATIGILLLGLLVLLAYKPEAEAGLAERSGITLCMSRLMPMYDSLGQRLAHKAVLVATLAIALLAIRYGRRVDLSPLMSARAEGAIAAALLTFWSISAALDWQYRRIHLILGTILIAAFYALTARGLRSRLKPLHIASLLGALALATVPGFFGTLDLSRHPGWHVCMIEMHYSFVATHGDRLAAGLTLFDLVTPQYGLLVPTVIASFEKNVRLLSVGDYVLLIRGVQTLYLALTAYLFYVYSRKKPHLVLIPLLAPLAWFNFYQPGIEVPNQSPLRTIGFPVGILVLTLAKNWRARPAGLALGFLSGWLLVLNTETGIAIAFGLLVYGGLRYRLWERPREVVTLGAIFLVGFVGALAVFVCVFRAGVGTWPLLSKSYRAVAFALLWESTGFGGQKLEFHPLAILILGHSVFVLINTGLECSRGEALSFKTCFRGSIAAMTLVWFAYYVNRPGQWSVASYNLLYGFLLIDVLKVVSTTSWRSKRRLARLTIAVSTFALVVLPETSEVCFMAKGSMLTGLRFLKNGPADTDAVEVSGIFLCRAQADQILKQAAYLRKQSSHEHLLYLTQDNLFLPKLSGVYPKLPFNETCVVTQKEYRTLVERVLSLDPDVIYFDPKSSPISHPDVDLYYAQLQHDLSARYERAETVSSWEAWRRKPR